MISRRLTAVALVGSFLLGLPEARAQSADTLAPPENLVPDGMPPVPRSLVDQVRPYTEYRSAGLADWHPSRREMLIATRFANTPQIHRVTLPLGARSQLTFFDEPVTFASYQPRTGAYFLFTKDVGGNEFGQIYRYDFATRRSVRLTRGDRSQNDGIRWSHTGDRIAYGSTRRNGADRDLYVMNPADSSSDRLVLQVQGGGWRAADWSPDDRRLVAVEQLSINRARLWQVEVADGTRRELVPLGASDTVAYGDARFSADGRSLYVTTDQDSEFQRLARVDLATRRVTVLTPLIEHDVAAFEPSPDGRTIAFVVNQDGRFVLYLLDTGSGRYRPVRGVPLGIIGGLRWHRTRKLLGFTLSTIRSPGDVYVLNPASQALTRWTESETGGLDTSTLPEPKLIRWTSFDGREITGFYYRPPARFTGKRPVIVDIHGGPEGQALPGFRGRQTYFLAELGVALIEPNVRGSTGYGKSFTKLDNGMRRLDSVRDIGALLDWIAGQPDLDADRVMVTGGSYGGYMTLAVATMYDRRVRSSLDVVGISNFITFLTNTESYRRDLRRVEYGDERDPAMRAFFEKIAPVNQTDSITKPMFVVQGANDPRVPRTESEQMVKQVRDRGKSVWYLLAKDEGHGFRKKANVDYLFYSSVEFVRRTLFDLAP
ncbi:MAG TPA: prolyl oligopeptidase family serine peptidase [Gemmatimonadales bacterium]|nr:prolyl oligopeptidase family serine peptidase [Gemmatimonadales bacterium]